MGCAQPTTGWKENPRALPEATLFHESGWSQKCHELQFHSKWRRDSRKVFLQASSKYKFTCLCCLKRHLESKPKITSSLRICIHLCNMIRKDCTLKPKDAIEKANKLWNKGTYIWRRPLQERSLACKNNWIIKGLEQCRIYFSFCRSFLPAQKPFLNLLKTNVIWGHSSTLKLFCEKEGEWNQVFFKGHVLFHPNSPEEIISTLFSSTSSFSPGTPWEQHMQNTRGLLGILLPPDTMILALTGEVKGKWDHLGHSPLYSH